MVVTMVVTRVVAVQCCQVDRTTISLRDTPRSDSEQSTQHFGHCPRRTQTNRVTVDAQGSYTHAFYHDTQILESGQTQTPQHDNTTNTSTQRQGAKHFVNQDQPPTSSHHPPPSSTPTAYRSPKRTSPASAKCYDR